MCKLAYFHNKSLFGWLIAAVFSVLLPISSFSDTGNNLPTGYTPPPEGLTSLEWSKIQSQIQKDAYRISAINDGESKTWTAFNHRQGFQTKFERRGIRVYPKTKKGKTEWDWTLRTIGYGYGDDIQPVNEADVVVSDNRIEYRRGHLTEWYVVDQRGVEQGFTIEKPSHARGNGSLRVKMSVGGSLKPQSSQDGQSVFFKDETGNNLVKYQNLFVEDSLGQKIPAYLEVASASLSIVVEDRSAVYPIVIDPLIFTEEKNSLLMIQVREILSEKQFQLTVI